MSETQEKKVHLAWQKYFIYIKCISLSLLFSRTCAVPLFSGESEAIVATTLETANGVSASSISAQTLEHLTLIHIWEEKYCY